MESRDRGGVRGRRGLRVQVNRMGNKGLEKRWGCRGGIGEEGWSNANGDEEKTGKEREGRDKCKMW